MQGRRRSPRPSSRVGQKGEVAPRRTGRERSYSRFTETRRGGGGVRDDTCADRKRRPLCAAQALPRRIGPMILFRSSHFSIASAALILAGGCVQALADDVSLDNLTFTTKAGGTATIKHVEFDGTNLTKDEVAKLFSGTPTREELAPIIAKLQASKILVPEIVVTDKAGTGSMTFHDFQATGISAGKVAHMTLAGFDGTRHCARCRAGDHALRPDRDRRR